MLAGKGELAFSARRANVRRCRETSWSARPPLDGGRAIRDGLLQHRLTLNATRLKEQRGKPTQSS